MIKYIPKYKTINFLYLASIIGILSWYIMPEIKYRFTYVPMAIVCGVFVTIQIFIYPQIKRIFFRILPFMLMFSLMYALFAYPLDIKKGFWLFMVQILGLTPFFIFISLAQRNKINELKIIFYVLTFMIIITEIKTLIEIANSPLVSRDLTSGSIDDELTLIRMKGIAGNEFSYAMGVILPFLLSQFIIEKKRKLKVFFFTFFLLTLVFILKAQFAILIFLSIFSIFYMLIRMIKKTILRILIYIALIGLLFMLPTIFHYLSEVTQGAALQIRFEEISKFLNTGDTSGDDLSSRLGVYKNGILIFLKSPIWGNEVANEPHIFESHSIFIDFAGAVGIIGLIFYIKTLLLSKNKIVAIIGKKSEYSFFKASFLFFLLLASLNLNIGSFEVWLALFLYVPLGIIVYHPKRSQNKIKRRKYFYERKMEN